MEKQKRAILFARVDEWIFALDPFILDYRCRSLGMYCREHNLEIAYSFFVVDDSDSFERNVLPGITKGTLQADVIVVNYYHELAIGFKQATVTEGLFSCGIQILTLCKE